MFFKLTAKNAYRDLVRNARRIVISQLSDSDKAKAFAELYSMLQPQLHENERSLNSEAAFAARCQHWNEQTNIRSIRPVKNNRNPWLRFKREFEQSIQLSSDQAVRSVSIALAWFYHEPHRDDWIVD